MATVRGPKSRTRNFHRHSGMSSSNSTSSISSICVVSSAAAPPVMARYTPPNSRSTGSESASRPPLPMMARTPYCSRSPRVKRFMRELVVVPMQTFSYLPGPSLRTLGAVWMSTLPLRSIWGCSPRSNMAIWVASRMPITVPSMRSFWPACSSRRASRSAIGNLSLSSEAIGDLPLRRDDGAGTACRPALQVHGHRVLGDVRVRVLDVHAEHGGAAAQAHGADAELVGGRIQLVFEGRDDRVVAVRAERAQNGLFGQRRTEVGGAAQADADDGRRARLGAGVDDALEHELLHGADAVGRDEHLEEAHVLRARALGQAVQLEVAAGHELVVCMAGR